jgi:hypothetical protein
MSSKKETLSQLIIEKSKTVYSLDKASFVNKGDAVHKGYNIFSKPIILKSIKYTENDEHSEGMFYLMDDNLYINLGGKNIPLIPKQTTGWIFNEEERIASLSNFKIGIGTSQPTYSFEVKGESNFLDDVNFSRGIVIGNAKKAKKGMLRCDDNLGLQIFDGNLWETFVLKDEKNNEENEDDENKKPQKGIFDAIELTDDKIEIPIFFKTREKNGILQWNEELNTFGFFSESDNNINFANLNTKKIFAEKYILKSTSGNELIGEDELVTKKYVDIIAQGIKITQKAHFLVKHEPSHICKLNENNVEYIFPQNYDALSQYKNGKILCLYKCNGDKSLIFKITNSNGNIFEGKIIKLDCNNFEQQQTLLITEGEQYRNAMIFINDIDEAYFSGILMNQNLSLNFGGGIKRINDEVKINFDKQFFKINEQNELMLEIKNSEAFVDGLISGNKIQKKSINGEHICDESIKRHHILSGAIGNEEIENNAIMGHHISDDQISEKHIKPLNIKSNHIEEFAINSEHIGDTIIKNHHLDENIIFAKNLNSHIISSNHLEQFIIKTEHLAELCVTSKNIARGNIFEHHLSENIVKSVHLQKFIILSEHLGKNIIDESHLAPDVINSKHLQKNLIKLEHFDNQLKFNSSHLAHGFMKKEHLSAGIIEQEHIGKNVISGEHICEGAIENHHINEGSILKNHIQKAQIEGRHIKNGVINEYHLGGGVVTNNKIFDSSISSTKLMDGSVTREKIAPKSISNEKMITPYIKAKFGNHFVGKNVISLGETFELTTNPDYDLLQVRDDKYHISKSLEIGEENERCDLTCGAINCEKICNVEYENLLNITKKIEPMDKMIDKNQKNIQENMPVGSIIQYFGDAKILPSCWRICDGSLIQRYKYELYFTLHNIVGDELALPNLTSQNGIVHIIKL